MRRDPLTTFISYNILQLFEFVILKVQTVDSNCSIKNLCKNMFGDKIFYSIFFEFVYYLLIILQNYCFRQFLTTEK